MGASKELMMEMEMTRETARAILQKAGVLSRCPYHGEYYAGGHTDLEVAYKIANAGITRGEYAEPDAESRRELAAAIKREGEAWWNDTCGYCDKLEAD